MSRRRIPDEKRILREMTEIALSEDEKTADRLRALSFLSEKLTSEAERLEAMAKLDAVLEQIGEQE